MRYRASVVTGLIAPLVALTVVPDTAGPEKLAFPAGAFAAAGVYEYSCGLHPNMKGTVEVK